jgi:hypothetical protein
MRINCGRSCPPQHNPTLPQRLHRRVGRHGYGHLVSDCPPTAQSAAMTLRVIQGHPYGHSSRGGPCRSCPNGLRTQRRSAVHHEKCDSDQRGHMVPAPSIHQLIWHCMDPPGLVCANIPAGGPGSTSSRTFLTRHVLKGPSGSGNTVLSERSHVPDRSASSGSNS